MAQMSVAQYAAHRGVQSRAVSVALNSGRIKRAADGWIDSEQADKDWEANTNPRKSAANKRNGALGQALRKRRVARPAYAPVVDALPVETPMVEPPPDIGAFAQARAVRERFAALLAKIDYEERSGKLIDRAQVTSTAFNLMRVLRDSILAVPDRVAAQLAAESDAATVHRMLEAELRTVLDNVATMRTIATPRRGPIQYGNVG